MTEDEALFAAAINAPAERVHALALGDWFDEHDEHELALALREQPRLVDFLSELARWDVSPRLRPRDWVDADLVVVALFQPLPAALLIDRFRRLFPAPAWAPKTFDPHAKPDEGHSSAAESFIIRWQDARQRQIESLRRQAARCAAAWRQGPVFGPAADGLDPFEWRCCVLHELVVRGRDVAALPDALEHTLAMRERGHRLAWLPLELLPVESDCRHHLAEFLEHGYKTVSGPGARGSAISALSADHPSVVARLPASADDLAAVVHWTDWGVDLDAVALRLDRPIAADALGVDWLRSLGVESLSEQSGTVRVSDAVVLAKLFAAASVEGPDSGLGWGAHGRLRAWRSFGWLAGSDPGADVLAVAEEAERAAWFVFSAFYVINLLCLRPDGRSLAVLAVKVPY
jgi:hypothetical protein